MDRKCAPPRPIVIGQLGIGHNHGTEQMRSLRKLGDAFTVAGVAEGDPAWRQRRGAEPAYRDLPWLSEEQLLAMPEVEAISVECDVPDLVPTALRCLRAGKHVHLDKPGGESLADFRALFAEAAARGLHIQLGYILRHNPAIRFALDAARAGWLGQVFAIDAVMSRLDGPEMRAHYGRFAGGAMYIFGGYLIDLAISVLGRPERIVPFQRMTRPEADRLADNGLAVLEYPRATAVLRTAVVEFDGFHRRQLTICGDQGTVEVRPIEPVDQAPVPPRLVLNLARPCGGHPAGRSEVAFPVMGGRYDDQWRAFAAMIRGGAENPWPPAHELLLHECLLRASGYPC
ncbi:MAG: Gfo/Idh/MocA family oxidoreductase [Planctomycetes bacterium]|nr:Gfo/Idh/MocA family oxidoreductase [Planctomycetota bacterium]